MAPRANPHEADDVRKAMPAAKVEDLEPISHNLRAIKSKAEITLLNEVFEISAQAHNWAIRLTQVDAHEAYLRAITSFVLENNYAHQAYTPIVASGAHGRVLHYHLDNDILRSGELVLMDVGGRRFGYCADISRTWPVTCKFSPAQAEIYNIVLASQDGALELARTHATTTVTLQDIIRKCEEVAKKGLLELGFDKERLGQSYLHSCTHHLGLDVHDVSSAKVPIKEGVVFTLEPGIYVPDEDWIPQAYRKIAIRVEDDCYASDSTVECPTMTIAARSIKDIEEMCGSAVPTV
jgi:Xaa-Pro aminopeptidase